MENIKKIYLTVTKCLILTFAIGAVSLLSTYTSNALAGSSNFVTEARKGCKVFNPADPSFSDATYKAVWSGACVDGKISESGLLITEQISPQFFCKHNILNSREGLIHGVATSECMNGISFEKTYVDGVLHGIGWIAKPDGERIRFEYKNGVLISQVSENFAATPKTKNQGVFKNNQRDGQSEQTLLDGEKRVGEFKDGEIIKGIAFYPNNPVSGKTIYEGAFKDGFPHGKGKFTYEFGSYYEGDFENGKFHGQGRLIRPDGDYQIGMFKNGSYVPGSGNEKETLEARKEAEKEWKSQQQLRNVEAWNNSFLPYFPR